MVGNTSDNGVCCDTVGTSNVHAIILENTSELHQVPSKCSATSDSTTEDDSGEIPITTGKRFTCNECGATYVSQIKYLDHLNKHTGNKPYVCQQCNKQFLTLPYLKNHLKLHSAEYQYVCEICGKSFKLKNNLQMHELTHSKEKPYKCSHCDKGIGNPCLFFSTNSL